MRASPVLLRSLRRLPLTTKQAGKGYYKGNRTGAMGRHTKHGGYLLDAAKMRTYVMPDLTNFELTPFVDKNIDAKHSGRKGLWHPKRLIEMWKEAGGFH